MVLHVMIFACQDADDGQLLAHLRHGIRVARHQPGSRGAYLMYDPRAQTWLVLVAWQDHACWQKGGRPFQKVFLRYLTGKTQAEVLCTFWLPLTANAATRAMPLCGLSSA